MRLHACPNCGAMLFFVNYGCSNCGQQVEFDPDTDSFTPLATPCANRDAIDCNWRAPQPGALCRACDMTEVIPDDSGENRELWAESELAKRRVIVSLGRWGWFGPRDGGPLPEFSQLSETTSGGREAVTMGHQAGVVTINLAEADPAVRMARRESFDEPYRTMVGHYRHEIGHFMFERLAARDGFLDAFRALFGDERPDYGQALAAYHQSGPPPGWEGWCISAYATAHPHEDWAESFAHLLHITEIVDSAVNADVAGAAGVIQGYDPYLETDAEALLTAGGALGIALNHVNRSMGLSDIYPFVHTPKIREKLAFVHGWIRQPG